MITYFAYGANMDPVHMAKQCPGAERLGSAHLAERRFAIGAAGFGTALPSPGARVHGVLWRLTPAHVEALDAFEGIAEGMYRQEVLEVLTATGVPVRAMLYTAVDPAPGHPNLGYLERVIEVAREIGLPRDYVEGLCALRAA